MNNTTTMREPLVVFTAEEEKILTAFDAAAHDLMRAESQSRGEIPLCWLVCSDKIRSEYRKRVLDLVGAHRGFQGLQAPEVELSALFDRMIPKSLVDAWRAAELTAKSGRERQDPCAFFAG